jgi:hypothetical protein
VPGARSEEVNSLFSGKRQGSPLPFLLMHTVSGRYEDAARLFEAITTSDDHVEFLTLPRYRWLTRTLCESVEA